MPLTLEERERIAYITNSPEHPLTVLALEGEEAQQAEITRLEEEAKQFESERDREIEGLEQELEAAETNVHTLSGRVEDLEIEVGDLKEKIHAAGVDLV